MPFRYPTIARRQIVALLQPGAPVPADREPKSVSAGCESTPVHRPLWGAQQSTANHQRPPARSHCAYRCEEGGPNTLFVVVGAFTARAAPKPKQSPRPPKQMLGRVMSICTPPTMATRGWPTPKPSTMKGPSRQTDSCTAPGCGWPCTASTTSTDSSPTRRPL